MNTNQNTKANNKPATIEDTIQAALSVKSLPELLKLVDVDTSRIDPKAAARYLTSRGVDVSSLDDEMTIAVKMVTDANDVKDTANTNIASILGVIKAGKKFAEIDAPDGKGKIKDFKQFCGIYFPNYSYKSLALYADVGEFIYAPVAAGMPGYEAYKEIANFSPSKLKNLVAVFKDSDRLSRLPALLPAESVSSMSQNDIEKVAKETKTTKPRTQGDGTQEQDDKNAAAVQLHKMFIFGRTDAGEFDILITTPEEVKKQLFGMDEKAALAFVKWIAANIK